MARYFALKKGVFLVKGAKRYALYDTNCGLVYSLNEDAVILLRRLAGGKSVDGDHWFVKELVERQIIVEVEAPTQIEITTPDNVPYRVNKQAHSLDFLWLELTNRCNLKCVHCYAGSGEERYEDKMQVDEWCQVLFDASLAGARRVQFIGGEPLLYPRFLSVVACAVDAGFEEIEIFTNGLLVTEILLESLRKYQGVRFALSLYSDKPEVHDAITKVRGSWRKTVDSIKLLKEYGFHTRVEMVVMRQNQNEVGSTVRFLRELGVYSKIPDVIRPTGRGKERVLQPTRKEVWHLRVRTAPDFRTDLPSFLNAMFWNSCWAGKLTVTAEGDVLPCIFARNIIIGSVKEQRLVDILKSDLLRKYWSITKDQVKICKDCEYRYACHDCRPLVLSSGGDLFDRGPFCTYDPYEGVWRDLEENIRKISG